MTIPNLPAAMLNSPVLLNFQGSHFTIGEMQRSLTPLGWIVLILLIVFSCRLIFRAVRFLAKRGKLK